MPVVTVRVATVVDPLKFRDFHLEKVYQAPQLLKVAIGDRQTMLTLLHRFHPRGWQR